MAPLKRSGGNHPQHDFNAYPWLRGHGSIEACAFVQRVRR